MNEQEKLIRGADIIDLLNFLNIDMSKSNYTILSGAGYGIVIHLHSNNSKSFTYFKCVNGEFEIHNPLWLSMEDRLVIVGKLFNTGFKAMQIAMVLNLPRSSVYYDIDKLKLSGVIK